MGFYGPFIYLAAVIDRTGWPLSLMSWAVTVPFLIGAVVIANLPRLYARIGMPGTTVAGAVVTTLGVLGWAAAQHPWQLFVAAVATGAGLHPHTEAGRQAAPEALQPVHRRLRHRAFFADETLRAIYDASLGLAKQLGMGMVAEGVEDRGDWDFLCRTGCAMAQGYFIAKPMPADAMAGWIRAWGVRVLEERLNPPAV